MRQRLVLTCFASVGFCLALGACGGSSSETPPPLQPDPKGFHYASAPPPAAVAESDAGAAPLAHTLDDEEKPRAPARSTSGSPKPAH